MKTSFSKYIIPALVLLLLSGCGNLLEPPVSKGADDATTGYFSLSLGKKGAGRTILPDYTVDDFDRFELKFTPANGTPADQLFSVKGTLAEVSEIIPLKAGNYTLTVTACFVEGEGAEEQEKEAARKELPIVITAGNTTTENVALEPVPGGKGTFTWEITLYNPDYPEYMYGELTAAEMRVTNINNTSDVRVIDFFDPDDPHYVEAGTVSESSLDNLDAGYYRVVITLTNTNNNTAEWREILHVYQNMESVFIKDLSDLYFHNNAVEITNYGDFGLEQYYPTLGAAITAANTVTGSSEENPVEILLLNDVNAYAGYTVQKNIRLLGNDYTIYAGAGEFPLFTVSGSGATLQLGDADDPYTLTLDGYGYDGSAENNRRGVYVTAGKLIMEENATIQDFNGLLGGGGGVRITDSGTFDMRGGSIKRNNNEQDGGGVYINGGTFTMSGGSITENDGGYDHNRFGGGVYVANGSFTMTGGTISGNKAQFGGGVAIYGSGDTFTMRDGTIKGNTANSSGGGVSVTEGSLILEGGTIYGSGEAVDPNTVTNPGGSGAAVHLIYNGSARYGGIYGNSVIGTSGYNHDEAIGIDNTLPDAGARAEPPAQVGLYKKQVDGTYPGTPILGSNNLSDVIGAVNTNVDGEYFFVTDNYSVMNLPPAIILGKTLTIKSIGMMEGGTTNNTIKLETTGSLLTVNSGATLILEGVTLDGNGTNTAALVTVSGTLTMQSGSIITGNTNTTPAAATDLYGGGGVSVRGGTLAMAGGRIEGNRAASGGGVYFSNGTFTMSADSFITNNIARAYTDALSGKGGGVQIGADGDPAVNIGTVTLNGTISENSAVEQGGGVYVMRGNVTSAGKIISNGMPTGSRGSGGGVAVSGGSFTLNTGGFISGNTVAGETNSGSGGGVDVSGGTFTLAGGTISGNKAGASTGLGGGGVQVSGGTFRMTSGTISGNEAKSASYGYGGGVFVTDGTFIKEGGTIYGGAAAGSDGTYPLANTASAVTRGHAVYVMGNSTANPPVPPKYQDDTAGEGDGMRSDTPGAAGGWYEEPAGTGEPTAQGLYEVVQDGWVDTNVPLVPLGVVIDYINDDEEGDANYLLVLSSGYSIITPNPLPALGGDNYLGYGELTLAIKGADATSILAYSGEAEQGTGMSLLTVLAPAEVTLTNITLEGNANNTGALVNIGTVVDDPGGLLTMGTGAVIRGNTNLNENNGLESIYTGGGVNIWEGGELVMNSGARIEDNHSTGPSAYGGGVYVGWGGGRLLMNPGVVIQRFIYSGNSGDGGGVCVSGGEFTMNGGEIKGNKATKGGGVFVLQDTGKFIMKGGTIRGTNEGGDSNTATFDGSASLGILNETVTATYGDGTKIITSGTTTDVTLTGKQ